jgi:hypothetical protein
LSSVQKLQSASKIDKLSPIISLSSNAGAAALSYKSYYLSSGGNTLSERLSNSSAAGK